MKSAIIPVDCLRTASNWVLTTKQLCVILILLHSQKIVHSGVVRSKCNYVPATGS